MGAQTAPIAAAESNLGPVTATNMLIVEIVKPLADDRNKNKRYSLIGSGKSCVFVSTPGRKLPIVGQKIVYVHRTATNDQGQPFEGKFWSSTFESHMGSNLAVQEQLYLAEQLASIRVNEATQRADALNAGSAAKVASEL